MTRERAAEVIDATEVPMLLLAALAVGIYLADLSGLSADQRAVAHVAALVIDAIFVLDLAVKVAVLRRSYLRGPWFVVDAVCAIPILASLSIGPAALQGLRFARMFRILRALRMLRALRSLRILRLVSAKSAMTPESRVYERVIRIAVILYALGFVVAVITARSGQPPGEVLSIEGIDGPTVMVSYLDAHGETQTAELPIDHVVADPDRSELVLVSGSLMGMLLVMVVARFQIPALWSTQISALLNVALPEQVAQYLLDHPERYDDSVRMPATVIFCDIKGFTATVEELGLDDLKSHLEQALDAVVQAHLGQDLIIDKFIGDAVMSFRGGNIAGGDPEDVAYRVVRGALDGMQALRDLGDPYFSEVKIGGASADDMLIGAFGTSSRLSYTVLGDRVNLAARLEASCNALGVDNLFCDRTHALTADRADLVWRRVGCIRVQGKEETTEAWQAFDASTDTSWLARYHAALSCYEARRFEEAAQGFEGLPGDGPSRLYLSRCRDLVGAVPVDWSPVLETRK